MKDEALTEVLPFWQHATSINGLLSTTCYYFILQAYNNSLSNKAFMILQ